MRRRLALGLALAATLALTAWVQFAADAPLPAPDTGAGSLASRADAPLRLADRSAATSAATSASTVDLPLQLPDRAAAAARAPSNLFQAARPAPSRAVQPVLAEPPPAPSAPPLPFAFGGRLVIDGETAWLLVEGARTLIVREGETIGEFVLESASDSGLRFRHAPTGLEVGLLIER